MSTKTMVGEPPEVWEEKRSECTFRANPECELVLFDRLSAREREHLGDLCEDASTFGLIRSRSANGTTIKAVCRETAALFQFLREPSRLPTFVIADPNSELTIRRLVWDGILQVTHRSEWVCGPAACQIEGLDPVDQSQGVLGELSLRAIRHVAWLQSTNASELSEILYRYNTQPLTPRWLREIPNGVPLEEYLQVQPGGRCRRDLDRDWVRVSTRTAQDAWLAWDSLSIPSQRTDDGDYKLYLSPLPAYVREALRAAIPAISAAGANHFKVGNSVRGLLRPDKMVAYFTDLSGLHEAAERIKKQLSGCPAQGVPFTAELGCSGLISWGADPVPDRTGLVGLRGQSWREWICNRLGSALAVSKNQPRDSMPADRFALERLRLEGVDVATWTSLSAPHRKVAP